MTTTTPHKTNTTSPFFTPAPCVPCGGGSVKAAATKVIAEEKATTPYVLTKDEMKRLNASVAPQPEVGVFEEGSKEVLVDFLIGDHLPESIMEAFAADDESLLVATETLVDVAYSTSNGRVSVVTAFPILFSLVMAVSEIDNDIRLSVDAQLIYIMEVFKGMTLIAFSGKVPKSFMEELGNVYPAMSSWAVNIATPINQSFEQDPLKSLLTAFSEFIRTKSKSKNSKGKNSKGKNSKGKNGKGKGRSSASKKEEVQEEEEDEEEGEEGEEREEGKKSRKRTNSRLRRMKQKKDERGDMKKCGCSK